VPELTDVRRGLSGSLLRFLDESPLERGPVLASVRAFADSLAPGTQVVDLGAGDGPYRELFGHVAYTTVDWGNSPHEDAVAVDVQASLTDPLPFADGAFDAAMLTQVLEHVPEPSAVVGEVHRILRPGGRLLVTVPYIWEEHERPYDFWRYSTAGLRFVLESAGFTDVAIEPRSDCFSTLAQLMRNMAFAMGRAPDGRDPEREEASRLLTELSGSVLALAPLDTQRIFPLGWQALAKRGA
jgi:SAM-dependent methyltransferase